MTDAGLKSLGFFIFLGLMMNGCMSNETTRVYLNGVIQEGQK